MKEYPLQQAAYRAGMDERSFRHLADRRVIYATPATRTLGKGKQKFYSTNEVIIASVLAPLVKLGASPHVLASVADWVRAHSGGSHFQKARNGRPVFIKLAYDGGESWSGLLEEAEEVSDRKFRISAAAPGEDEGQASEFVAINLGRRITRAEMDWIRFWKRGAKPSEICAAASMGNDPDELQGHTPEEIKALLAEAEAAAANGDVWPKEHTTDGGRNER